jgi:hypothetical protein
MNHNPDIVKRTEILSCHEGDMKITLWWDIAQCSLLDVDRQILTAEIIALMLEAVRTSERRLTSTKLHGEVSRKTGIYKQEVPKNLHRRHLIKISPVLLREAWHQSLLATFGATFAPSLA